MTEEWDVVVVGAGTAGCPLAARLADAGRRVLLLEAGQDHPEGFPAVFRDAAAMGAAVPGHPANWDLAGDLSDEVTARVARGRVVGGSSALNAGAFIRGTPADFDGWAAAGNDLWSADRVLPALRRLEADADFGDRPAHGSGGPVPVRRPAAGHPLTDAFGAAAEELGFPPEPDKNGGGPPGYGPLPFTVVDGVRVNSAMAYLAPRQGRPGPTVRGGQQVLRVLVERGRAVGVRTTAGEVRGGEVVLSAGAVGSAHLLLLSGIGPADTLRAAGLDVVADLPGVGAEFSDHPVVYVPYRPAHEFPSSQPLHSALHTTSDLELLPWLAPFDRVMVDRSAGLPPAGATAELPLGVALMREQSRGRLSLAGADPLVQPRLEYRYLTAAADLRRMREGVRLAAELLRAPALAPLVTRGHALPDDVLDTDADLDRWIGRHLATAVHLSGTARMGPDSDAGAVVDQRLRVRGVAGLRVADTSVLPWVPSRGTAATAVLVGEYAAELMLGEELSRPDGRPER